METDRREGKAQRGVGGGMLEGQGRGGEGPPSVAPSSGASHSLSAPIPDRWREGENWCQEAVTAGGQSWGRVLCGQGLYGEGAAAGGLAAGPPWSQLPRHGLSGGGIVDAVGQGSGQGVSLPPACLGLAVSLPLSRQRQLPLSPPLPAASKALPPRTPPPPSGCWGG